MLTKCFHSFLVDSQSLSIDNRTFLFTEVCLPKFTPTTSLFPTNRFSRFSFFSLLLFCMRGWSIHTLFARLIPLLLQLVLLSAIFYVFNFNDSFSCLLLYYTHTPAPTFPQTLPSLILLSTQANFHCLTFQGLCFISHIINTV